MRLAEALSTCALGIETLVSAYIEGFPSEARMGVDLVLKIGVFGQQLGHDSAVTVQRLEEFSLVGGEWQQG